MAADSSFMSEDQFMCSICLDVFTEPVSIPCGHNFCKACIGLHWKDKELCKCPLCNEKFNKGLKLCVNTAFREVVENFKKQNVKSNSESVRPGQVACDCCLGNKFKASKTCLVCLTSFCETHLQPHRKVAALKRHKLINPVHNLEDKICKKHSRILELFCWNDQMNICALCTEHSGHHTTPLEEAQVERTALMGKKKAEAQIVKQRNGKKGKKCKTQATWKSRDAAKVLFRLVPECMGLSEGRFCYAVKLSGGSNWLLGVVRESILMKKDREIDPQNGSWLIMLGDKCDCTPLIKDPVTFHLKKKPERVVVCVDYDNKLVIFCDSETNEPIFSFSGCDFNERVFLFCGEAANGWVQNVQLRIKNMTFSEILLGFFLMVICLILVSEN
ncbi:uncharacterized protein LOC141801136 [Halichoeres trimaculatus]|uniref:uncharacterized protein LOC141801136 n=1 Tax=Halichoeres trimaculatus TaxID=147232 RepID=UPI003D9E5B39